jgi:glycosyltransferase involved in cell wall biosynthesis
MRVLILAPHPFYQERGTPIAVDLLLRALIERGDKVDVLTYHEGTNRDYENASIYRIKPILKIKNIRPGFSWKKLFCDVHLFASFIRRIRKGQYDVVHAVEETAFMAMLLCSVYPYLFVFDMDSSMAAQLVDKFRFLRPLRAVLQFLESQPIRFADAVVPMCDVLAEQARQYRLKNIMVLRDVSLISRETDGSTVEQLRRGRVSKIVMYIGNLEHYQGIDLLLESFALVAQRSWDVRLAVIGGELDDIAKYRSQSQMLGIGEKVIFLGKKPVGDIGNYMKQADVLVSPRIQGVNTPMKVYSYLHSGKAVLATRLPTHTQVISKDFAVFADPEPHAFASAMLKLLEDDGFRSSLGARAVDFIEREHSYETFRSRVFELYQQLEEMRAEKHF